MITPIEYQSAQFKRTNYPYTVLLYIYTRGLGFIWSYFTSYLGLYMAGGANLILRGPSR